MLLRTLVEWSGQFSDLPPVGYRKAGIRWVLDIHSSLGADLLEMEGTLRKDVPVRGDRAGKATEDNSKASLFVDKASYVLGLKPKGEINTAGPEHTGFLDLLENASHDVAEIEFSKILRFLREKWGRTSVPNESKRMSRLRDRVRKEVSHNDLVALRAGGKMFPFETPAVRSFWADWLDKKCWEGVGFCSICGDEGRIARILPFQVGLFADYSCPFSSFNETSFTSFGKKQTSNSPTCFGCASRASQVLQYLVQSPRHSAVLAKDESKEESKTPLSNQLAVFWLKDETPQAATHAGRRIDLSVLKAPLNPDALLAAPPAEIGQMKSLLGIPWSAERSALGLDDNSFYLAVLSPNKSRLVLREWMEESVGTAAQKLSMFIDGASIVDSDGAEVVFPTIPRMLESLRPWSSRSARVDANLMRGLLRTAYRGLRPPHGLLEQAVQRFRVQGRPKDGSEQNEMAARWTVLAAIMKLVITYGKEEAITLQRLDTSGRDSGYLSGRLLAVLEEAQMRAARWDINSTLVDRCYGAASTAPGSVLGQLLNQSTKSHMPKIRKKGMGYQELEELLENTLRLLDDQGGFPRTLTLNQQGEFALGFYHQRGVFRASRPSRTARGSQAETEQKAEIEQEGESK